MKASISWINTGRLELQETYCRRRDAMVLDVRGDVFVVRVRALSDSQMEIAA